MIKLYQLDIQKLEQQGEKKEFIEQEFQRVYKNPIYDFYS